ncbi:hypothetical protein FQN60_002069 [Etheostoma spectabile]|uniref:Uncharacterized protein n=1 Tax=Etheostoma spectabile TaxID=54343 RepID=A0A5J5DDA6_9PERO|nr:hypothetical protein FQN60_002069 [Etheostoma spectabile]
MDSSPVLRQQSQNKIRNDFMRTKNDYNKMPAHPKPSEGLSAPHLSNQNIENQEPGNSELGRKAPVRPGVSRLPVLAKSLCLPTSSDFTKSHYRWEEKPLAGKTKKKKPSTRPVPFNLSQPKSSRMATEDQQPLTSLQSRTGTRAVQPENNPTVGTEACLDNMSLLSLKDPAKMPHANQNLQLTTQGNFSKSATDKGENFQSDHAAMLSILRNEGISAAGLRSANSPSRPYNFLPQRVSVMKSRQKAGPTTGIHNLRNNVYLNNQYVITVDVNAVKPNQSNWSMQFSPDHAALQSILQNEGVKGRGPVGSPPRSSVCQSGRGTSIYTAQRVPVRKNRAEATGGPAAVEENWTPQRVRNTRHQPMSAMKCYLSTQQSGYTGTPRLRSSKANLQPHQEEIVQRLFADQEDEQSTNVSDKDPETRAGQLPVQATTTKSHSEEKAEASRVSSEEEEEVKEEQSIVGGQPFFQATQRESVIFFSTGKTLLKAPRFEKRHEPHGPVLPGHKETSSVSVPVCQTNPSVHSLHRDVIVQKTCVPSLAVAMLRKRLLCLEELRMDEEVASYTSGSVPAAPRYLPLQPRCGNPLASILHSEESFTFVPIGFNLSFGPSTPHSSPLQER